MCVCCNLCLCLLSAYINTEICSVNFAPFLSFFSLSVATTMSAKSTKTTDRIIFIRTRTRQIKRLASSKRKKITTQTSQTDFFRLVNLGLILFEFAQEKSHKSIVWFAAFCCLANKNIKHIYVLK